MKEVQPTLCILLPLQGHWEFCGVNRIGLSFFHCQFGNPAWSTFQLLKCCYHCLLSYSYYPSGSVPSVGVAGGSRGGFFHSLDHSWNSADFLTILVQGYLISSLMTLQFLTEANNWINLIFVAVGRISLGENCYMHLVVCKAHE